MTIDLEHELTKGFAANLIRQKARQLVRRPEFTKSDGPDLQQEMRLRVIEAYPKFDPKVAHWNAFVTAVVERHVATILEYETAGKRFDEDGVESLNTLVADADGNMVQRAQTIGRDDRDRLTCEQTPAAEEISDLRLELEGIEADLPPELRIVFEGLKTKHVTELARELGIPRQTLVDRVHKLRAIFEERGLQDYFDKSP